MTDTTWTPDSLPDYQQNVPAYSVFDVNVAYQWKSGWKWLKSAKLAVGVNNIANRLPPKSATFDSFSNADVTEFSPIGRLYCLSFGTKF